MTGDIDPAAVGTSEPRHPSARHAWAIAVAAGVLSIVMRVPFVPRWATSWDAVQYILAIRDFDPLRHQPHPPGCYLFVKLAALGHALGLSEELALVAINLVAAAAMTGLLAWWVARWEGAWAGATTAVLAVSSPLVWLAALDGRPYALGALGAVATAWLCWRTVRGDHRAVIASGVVIGLLAGVRPTDALFLAPLWLWALARSGPRWAAGGLAVGAVTVAAWAVPMLGEAGGVDAYLMASRRLGTGIGGHSPLMTGEVSGLWSNLVELGAGLFLLVMAGWCGLPRGLVSELGRPRAWVALAVLPALAFFALVHTAVPLYAMVLAPLLAVAGAGLDRLLGEGLSVRARVVALALVTALHAPFVVRMALEPTAHRARYCERVVDACGEYDRPTTVAITTGIRAEDGANEEPYVPYRHAMYLLPSLHAYMLPLDMLGPAGTMPNYGHEMRTGMVRPPVVHAQARTLLLLGEGLLRYLPDDRRASAVGEADDVRIFRVDIAAGEVLRLEADGRVRVVPEDHSGVISATGSGGLSSPPSR